MKKSIMKLTENELDNVSGGKIIVSKETFELIEGVVGFAGSIAFACVVYYYRARIEGKKE